MDQSLSSLHQHHGRAKGPRSTRHFQSHLRPFKFSPNLDENSSPVFAMARASAHWTLTLAKNRPAGVQGSANAKF
jgi:hypothetical protein